MIRPRAPRPIFFVADGHYGTRAGRVLYESLRNHYPIRFHEDDWSGLAEELDAREHSLLVLHCIAEGGSLPRPPPQAELRVKRYLESGGNVLLLHGSSAAFWNWDWWRPLVGLRWVRPDDPDGAAPSTHPIRSYLARPSKTRHPLASRLQDVRVLEDELYMDLEQTGPVTVLMDARVNEGTFPIGYLAATPWGGFMAGYLPGHAPRVVSLPENIGNCRAFIEWLMK